MERIFASWDLMSRSFRVLKADKELMWLPVLSAISCVFVTAATVAGGAALFYPEIHSVIEAGGKGQPDAQFLMGATFVFYLVIDIRINNAIQWSRPERGRLHETSRFAS